MWAPVILNFLGWLRSLCMKEQRTEKVFRFEGVAALIWKKIASLSSLRRYYLIVKAPTAKLPRLIFSKRHDPQ
jgi:hypothetical protein